MIREEDLKIIQYSSFRKLVRLREELKKMGYRGSFEGTNLNLLRKDIQKILKCRYNRARTYLYTLILLEKILAGE